MKLNMPSVQNVIGLNPIAVFLMAPTGCVCIHSDTERGGYEPTFGQQMIDLKKTTMGGVITPAEYRTMKRKRVFICV